MVKIGTKRYIISGESEIGIPRFVGPSKAGSAVIDYEDARRFRTRAEAEKFVERMKLALVAPIFILTEEVVA